MKNQVLSRVIIDWIHKFHSFKRFDWPIKQRLWLVPLQFPWIQLFELPKYSVNEDLLLPQRDFLQGFNIYFAI